MILLPHPAPISQPQGRVDVDWSNPITRGLLGAYVVQNGLVVLDAVTQQTLPTTGRTPHLVRSDGYALPGEGGTSQTRAAWRDSFPFDLTTASGITLMARAAATTSSAVNTYLIALASTASNNQLAALAISAATGEVYRPRIFVRDNTNTVRGEALATDTNYLSDLKVKTIAGSFPKDGGTARLYGDGNELGTATATAFSAFDVNTLGLGSLRRAAGSNVFRGPVFGGAVWGRELSERELSSITRNPWQLFATPRGRSFVPVGDTAAGTTTSDGTLAAQDASAAGSATRLALHTTSGALSVAAATVSGSSQHQRASAGALAAQAASAAGSATRLALHTTSGALSVAAATVSGAAEHSIPGQFTASGVVVAQASSVAGSATRLALHTTSGAIQSASSTISGSAQILVPRQAVGALPAQSAAVVGVAARLGLHDSSGALQASDAIIVGRDKDVQPRSRGGSRSFILPPELVDAQLSGLIVADELLLLVSSAVALQLLKEQQPE